MRGLLYIGVVGWTALLLTVVALAPAHAAPNGTAVVIATDSPDNCLRIRSGPGLTYPVVGCAGLGESLRLTGVTASNYWVEISAPIPGWVYRPQIEIRVATYVPPLEYVVPGMVGAYVTGYPYRYWRYGAAYPWWVYKRRHIGPYPYVYRHWRRGISPKVGYVGKAYGYRGFYRGAVGVRSAAFSRGSVGLRSGGVRAFSGGGGRGRRR